MFKKIGFGIMLLGIVSINAFAGAVSFPQKSISSEDSTAKVDIRYPKIGYADHDIRAFLQKLEQQFKKSLSEDATLPPEVPGKSELFVRYELPYQTKNALSIVFNVSEMHRGAAHPMNTIHTMNYIHKKQVSLSDLFKSSTPYLSKIASYCKAQLLAKKVSDPDWVTKGTAPTAENFEDWTFNHKGLTIIFDTYQVASYANGPQSIEISYSFLKDYIKSDYAAVLWG